MAGSCQIDDEFESEDLDVDREEDLSRFYVFRGFEYKIIILLLLKNMTLNQPKHIEKTD